MPLDYTLVAEIYDESGNKITEPITATICNESGTAVTGSVSMTGDSATKTTHTYKLKLEWDASKNSADYAGKTYSYKIKVVATPNATATESKYADYTLTKETTANITTAPFYFVTDPTSVETTTIEMADNKAAINLTVSNNNGTNYNIFETTYTISLDNTDFTLWVDGTEYANNVTNARQLGKGSLTNMVDPISLVPKTTSTTLTKEEICNLTITTTSPYVKTETIKIIATDKTNPTAPTITGGSEGTYATSQTVSVSKEATDVGTGVKYYQYLIDSDGQSLATTETGNVGSTATAKSKKFSTNYDGYYVYFRAVDAVGNVSDWSNEQRLYIDTKAPKVTVKSEDVAEIEPGTSVDLEEYFTISKNGTAPYTITWTNQTTGDTISNKQYTFEEEGTYQITCKVTKENGLSASATKTLQVESAGPFTAVDVANAPTKFYGADIMNYDSYGDPNVGWKVFHSDEENIYLIADDYIHYDYAPTSENYTLTNYSDYEIGFGDLYNDYSGSSSILDAEITDSRVLKWIEYVNDYQASEEVNIKAVSFMLDTRKWNILYRNYTYADYAIGGPTLKMFVDSYNARYPGDNIRISYDSVGYFVGFEGASQGGSITVTAISVDDLFFLDETRTEGMWLAGPSSSSANFVFTASSNGRILSFNARTRKYCGFRPVVCLKSGVTLEKVGNGQYNLVEPPAPALPEEETELVVGSVSGSFNCEDDTLTSEDISVNIPSGVNVVKLSIVGGVSGTGLGTMIWVRNVSSGTTWNDTYRRVYDGTFELERFVGVTPEKNYSIRISVYDEDLIDTFGSINFEYRITYSKSINAVTPDKEDL